MNFRNRFGEEHKKLSEKLDMCRKVTSYNVGNEKESATLSHAFLDLEESFLKFSNELLPKLKNDELTEKEIEGLLLDVGEEFRHILYHIKDPKFYRYLFPGE